MVGPPPNRFRVVGFHPEPLGQEVYHLEQMTMWIQDDASTSKTLQNNMFDIYLHLLTVSSPPNT